MYTFNLRLSDINIRYNLRFYDTKKYLESFVSPSNVNSDECVFLSDFDLEQWQDGGNKVNAFAEFSLLHLPTSTYLLNYNRFIFHAVALRWHDKAWLITALPGVGKSTQYRNLKELHPDEISIINGDKPILELKEDGSFMVHPSPWNGKEHWHGAEAAPLAGIICLRQDKENQIQRVTAKEVVSQIYISIHHTYETERTILQAGKMANALLKAVPVWMLSNKGDLESSELLYQTIKQWDKEHEVQD